MAALDPSYLGKTVLNLGKQNEEAGCNMDENEKEKREESQSLCSIADLELFGKVMYKLALLLHQLQNFEESKQTQYFIHFPNSCDSNNRVGI
jgi:hypothetical protein